MRAPITDKHLLEMMWERFPEIMQRGAEQPAQQEPVAWQWKTTMNFLKTVPANAEAGIWRPVYTSPPPQRTWVGLTDGDIYKMTILMGFNPEWKPEVEMVYSIVRNLEAKLKEKNT